MSEKLCLEKVYVVLVKRKKEQTEKSFSREKESFFFA